MAQHDYVIANNTGANVRADINSVLQAIASNNSGSSAPSTTFALQFYADTSNNILKLRNAANDGFINLFTLAGGVDVDAASNFNEDVTFTGASANIVFDKSSNELLFADNAKSSFGNNGDMVIKHDGSNSEIINTTGSLLIDGQSTLTLRSAGNITGQVNDSETAFQGIANGAFEAYFDNSKKIETHSGGVNLLGSGTDAIQMTGDVWFNNNEHAGADVYFNSGDKKLLWEDNVKAVFGGGGDLEIIHNGTDSIITNSTNAFFIKSQASARTLTDAFIVNNFADNEAILDGRVNDEVKAFYDGAQKFATKSYGAAVTGNFVTTGAITIESGNNLNLADNGEIVLGNSTDFVIRHIPGSRHEILAAASAPFQIRGDTQSFLSENGVEDLIKAVKNGAVELYFDSTKRFETLSDGTQIKGVSHLISEDGNATAFKKVKYFNINTSSSLTITLASLMTGYGVFRMGGYANAGQAAVGLHIIFGGFMTGTTYYQADVLQNFTAANSSISLAKNAGNYVITVNNTSSSQSLIVSMTLESSGAEMTMTLS